MNPSQNNSRRRSCYQVIREAPGPSTQAHRSIIKESVRSAWDLFIDEGMLRHIQRCTEEEARRVLQIDDRRVSLYELDAFLSIVYARGAHKAIKIKVHELWNRSWAIPIISETVARSRFIEIMKFLRFDYNQTRSHRLATDKLALISTVWYIFVGNCLVDFDQRYSAYPTPTYPSDSVSVAKNSKDETGKTKSARNFIIH